jgi:hypothetical protein
MLAGVGAAIHTKISVLPPPKQAVPLALRAGCRDYSGTAPRLALPGGSSLGLDILIMSSVD